MASALAIAGRASRSTGLDLVALVERPGDIGTVATERMGLVEPAQDELGRGGGQLLTAATCSRPVLCSGGIEYPAGRHDQDAAAARAYLGAIAMAEPR